MADALTFRGLAVTVVEHSDTGMKTVDPSLGQLVGAQLQHQGVKVVNSVAVKAITQSDS